MNLSELKIAKALDLDNRVSQYHAQFKFGPYRLDFAVLLLSGNGLFSWIDIEVDGPYHRLPEARKRDKERDGWLREWGWVIVRIPYGHEHTISRTIDTVLTSNNPVNGARDAAAARCELRRRTREVERGTMAKLL